MHLVDPVPLQVEQARARSAAQPHAPLASVSGGDARRLDWSAEQVDAVLLLGPLYHLTERGDRIRALTEARRVLRPNGVVLVRVPWRIRGARECEASDAVGAEQLPHTTKYVRQIGEEEHGKAGKNVRERRRLELQRADIHQLHRCVRQLLGFEGPPGVRQHFGGDIDTNGPTTRANPAWGGQQNRTASGAQVQDNITRPYLSDLHQPAPGVRKVRRPFFGVSGRYARVE